jgi:hypothetical protein
MAEKKTISGPELVRYQQMFKNMSEVAMVEGNELPYGGDFDAYLSDKGYTRYRGPGEKNPERE